MAYRLPNFNLLMSVWVTGTTPIADPPSYTNVPCQKYIWSRFGGQDMEYDDSLLWVPAVCLRIPWDNADEWADGEIFMPTGNNPLYYRAAWKETMHDGFTNQYRVVIVAQCDAAGAVIAWNVTPYP